MGRSPIRNLRFLSDRHPDRRQIDTFRIAVGIRPNRWNLLPTLTGRGSHLLGGLLAAAMVVVLSGCVSMTEPRPTASPMTLIGLTLLEARPLLPQTAVLIYDLSTPILDIDPSYNEGEPQGRWTVVAQCGIGVGVIPVEDYEDDIASQAQSGDFDTMLTECGT